MRDHKGPVFTIFGGTYLPETPSNQHVQEPRNASTGMVTALLAVLIIGFMTAAAATAKSRSHWRAEYAVPMQPMSPFIAKLPGTIGFQEVLY